MTRLDRVLAVCTATVLLLTFAFLYTCSLLPGLAPKADSQKRAAQEAARRQTVTEGEIFDKNGAFLTQVEEGKSTAVCLYPQALSWLVGYNDPAMGAAGLRAVCGSELFTARSDGRGAALYTTLDLPLQLFAASLLDGREGSVIVLDNATGAIRALASCGPTAFDVNHLSDSLAAANQQEGALYRRGTYETDPPGSAGKVITAAAALADGIIDLSYSDTGSFTPLGTSSAIHNFADQTLGRLDLGTALLHSSNTYFAHLGTLVGSAQLAKQAEAFLIGRDIPLDFTTLRSSYGGVFATPAQLAQAAFGQGKLEITPLHLAMIYQSIAANGEMRKPYLIDHYVSGKRVYGASGVKTLARPISGATAKKLRELLHPVAESYGLDEAALKSADVPAPLSTVWAKSGTAQCPGGRLHCYLAASNSAYTYLISINNGKSSADLYAPMKALITASASGWDKK